MQVSVVKPEQGLEHKLSVSFPSNEFDAKVEKRLNEMRRTVKMDGFRPGKVPMNMVKKRYLPQVQQELLGETLHYAFFDAMDKEGYNPAGYPAFDDVKLENGEIKFEARFDVYPQITLPAFDSIEVEKLSAEVKEEDVDKMIQRLQEQRSAWKPAGAAKKANMGEQVIIDFVGKLDGVEFDGGKAENVPLELGSGRMIPGFEDGIIGMKKGETKTIDVTFPEQYQAEHLKGKTAQFDITVHSVQTKQLPELDEEFIKSFGIEDGTVESLRKEIRENMERELKRTLDAKNRQAAFDALEKAVDIEVPKSLVAQEAETMLENYMQRLEQQGMPKGQMPGLTADIFSEEAKKRVKLGLVIGDVIKANDIQASEADLDAFIAEQASAYEEPEEIKQWYKENPQRLNEARSVIVESAVAKKIMSEAKVNEVTKAFDEIVSASAA
ncbi:trigger factor [Thiomicrospira microaerophila]|uniref:trigger factor n=1 Tax=Thiomicrospira microaerophila TaxID=406020 RepID=UPI00200D06AF|nr:trigger factor [Thiomicrospira microaerophila]UQB41425.1 trigger factor [Thiomicrospira microaerophila]